MKLAKVLFASSLMGLSVSTAQAGISSTITLTSDYDFRGISQTARDPALQASLDYVDDRSGWYAGVWGSNVDFGDDTDLQANWYTGFSGKVDDKLGWNAGFVYRSYDNHHHDYPEIFAALNYSYFQAKVSYSNDYYGDYLPHHTNALYFSADADVPVAVPNLSVLAHLGRTAANHNFDDYTDYFVGVKYKVNQFDLSLRYVDTDTNALASSDVFDSGGRFIFSVATKLPW